MIQSTIFVLLPLFFVIGLGYFAGRTKRLDVHHMAGLNRILVDFALPASLFAGTVITPRAELLRLGPLLAALAAMYVLFWLIGNVVAHVWFHHGAGEAVVQATAVAFPNTGFMGVPILGGLFGASSIVAVAAATVLGVLMFIPSAVIVLEMVQGQRSGGQEKHWREVALPAFVNAARVPIVWAPMLAAVLVLLGVTVPKEILAMLNLIGGTTAGLAMFAAGLTLAMYPLRLDVEAIVSTIIKMILQPLAMLALVRLMQLSHPLDVQGVILTALPTPVLATSIGARYGTYQSEASSTLVLTSTTLIVTLPLWMLLLAP